ncbi:Myrosinase 1 [Papilio machaon]|uniref:Myrosinase 1 n=1 Tax=Papilio machaon TaxID=76193 RepID=A0A0N1IQN9_PAPMA|nr:Myrosinase 1 [Papilio machaon]
MVCPQRYFQTATTYGSSRSERITITSMGVDEHLGVPAARGWTNPLIADYFADYANYVFSLFGDRVKTWITINEAISVCDFAYNSGIIAPGIQEPIYGTYLCNKHILIAHAKAYRIYEKYYRPSQHGKVSFANNLLWIEPLTPADEELAELGLQHSVSLNDHVI